MPNLSCNNASLTNCAYCPYGYAMVSSNTNTNINQTCVACNSNCTRCLSTNPTTCTACASGYYLGTNSSCLACLAGCVSCTSTSICLACGYGYILFLPATLTTNAVQPAICLACISPCALCTNTVLTCTSCVSGYTLQGTQCVSVFNFQAFVMLSATPSTFNQQYLPFLQTIAGNMGVVLEQINILSIIYGSVNVTFQVSTTATPGSSVAASQQQSLQTTLGQNGNIAGMSITSSTITTNGGSNNNNNSSGLSQTTIIILATVIPIGTLRNFLFI